MNTEAHGIGQLSSGAPTLRRYYEIWDGPNSEGVFELLSPEYRFVTLFSNDGDVRQWEGDRRTLEEYMASRTLLDGHLHHLLLAMTAGRMELALGRTTLHGEHLSMFMNTIELDDTGRIRRYFAARSPQASFDLDTLLRLADDLRGS